MRYLATLLIVLVGGQIAFGQPSSEELIAKFRNKTGAAESADSVPYLIHYRGERYMYSMRDGKLQGDHYAFDSKLYGYTNQHKRHRKETEMKVGVVPVKIVEVINGGSGWYQFNDGEAVPMSKGELEGRQSREVHVEVFLGRQAFDPKIWQFTEPKSTSVRGQDVWSFDAKASGFEPLTLYFAKESSLLVRLKTKTTDFTWLPGEKPKIESFVRDLYLRDWKNYGKRMLPGLLEAYHDGVLWQQMESVNASFLKSVDPKLFNEPQPQK